MIAFVAAATAISFAVATCGTPDGLLRYLPFPGLWAPSFVDRGTIHRLNLPTARARASVLYKDSVQGVKDANGACRFPDIGQNSGKMRIGLMATVGEWDTVTCAGLLYYFKPSSRPYPPPTRVETTFVR